MGPSTILISIEEGRLSVVSASFRTATLLYILNDLINKATWNEGGSGKFVIWRDVLPHARKTTLHRPTFTISQKIDLEYKSNIVVVEVLVFRPYLPDARWFGMAHQHKDAGQESGPWHDKERACFNEENLHRGEWSDLPNNENQQGETETFPLAYEEYFAQPCGVKIQVGEREDLGLLSKREVAIATAPDLQLTLDQSLGGRAGRFETTTREEVLWIQKEGAQSGCNWQQGPNWSSLTKVVVVWCPGKRKRLTRWKEED
ncbi:hypothetical protein PPACK8108_LOCUS4448 [Phakopsora pachyrhizi]|uniref:Uncharacterized protein n=1 Tax=Phakopsora pachyrhizi TaxID=170000 RepID=A0AAV0APS7_PHAPC|nr:hypothetical protein PPACK8108_LOCUS4448 [Phakopsora pachyrhizi]